MKKCELCGSAVRVVGNTTKHYELVPAGTHIPIEDVAEMIAQAKEEIWEEAAYIIEGWQELHTEAHRTTKYKNPKEALREHRNQMNLLGVIKSKFLQNSGKDPKEIFHDNIKRRKDEHRTKA